MDQQTLSAQQFGATARQYLSSPVHSQGADLDRLTALAAALGPAKVLDLGCGAGHASYALAKGGAGHVVACDLATPMLDIVAQNAAARGYSQISTLHGPAEKLPFQDGCFDMIVTRFSAHHWLDVRAALHEMTRTLRPGGKLVVIDIVAPETPLLDTALQTVEILRDASHVRDYRESEWRNLLADAGVSRVVGDGWRLPMEFASWVARIATPVNRIAALKAVIDALPSEARRYYEFADDYSFSIDVRWLESA